jgi:hypothetical protein
MPGSDIVCHCSFLRICAS